MTCRFIPKRNRKTILTIARRACRFSLRAGEYNGLSQDGAFKIAPRRARLKRMRIRTHTNMQCTSTCTSVDSMVMHEHMYMCMSMDMYVYTSVGTDM